MARVGPQRHGGGELSFSLSPLTSPYTVQLGVLIFNLRWFSNAAVRQAYRTRTFQSELHSPEDKGRRYNSLPGDRLLTPQCFTTATEPCSPWTKTTQSLESVCQWWKQSHYSHCRKIEARRFRALY